MTHKFRGLALHTWTVDTTPLDGALAAARQGGFDAVELRRVDFLRNREKGLSDTQTIDLVKKSGLPAACVGVEYGWIFSSGAERDRLMGSMKEACQHAKALDCPMLMSAIGPGDASLDQAVDNIKRAGDIVGAAGLRIALEYQFQHPVITTLDILRDLVAKAGHKSVGVLLDAYHLQRGGRPGAGFKDMAPEEIFYVQYSDVPDAPPNGPPPTDRLAPGKGVGKWTELLQLLAAKNYTGYLSYEAPNPAHWNRPAAETAREGADATRQALARAFDGAANV